LAIADNFWTRFCGLQFRRPLPPGDGLILAPCGSIHTMWMRFAIDAAMLDREGRVLEVRRSIALWRIVSAPRGTHAVLETSAGNLRLRAGEIVALRPCGKKRQPPGALRGFSVTDT
jgi:uncharacterized protein